MHSHEANCDRLSRSDRDRLLLLARQSIEHGLRTGSPLKVAFRSYPESLQSRRSSFVTLQRSGVLRGCIGHLEAQQPLVTDVVENAFAAAFRDPRFPPVTEEELHDLEIHISVLSPPVPLQFGSQEELLDLLQPGIDGLVLQWGGRKGTFLPSVWTQLPDPADFLRHLKIKAGLKRDFWSDDIEILRYRTESFPTDMSEGIG